MEKSLDEIQVSQHQIGHGGNADGIAAALKHAWQRCRKRI